ncbi:MAG TPA: 3-dehydroquinate synthase [Acidobacteriaceae bacterium]|jgi:3-dehydroquinate synthase|nr:3-dehydroquinate synthase [Acidobacteriaceae bacterium]
MIPVRTPSASYAVEIGSGLLSSVADRLDGLLNGGLKAGKQRAFIVSSPEILDLWGERLLAGFDGTPVLLQVPSGESHKRLGTVERLAEEMAEAGADRDSILVAFGGGVIGDMTGFLAAIYMRGIRYIQVPTTFLAQVDSSLGGKTGVNLAAGKNLAGAFHHPLAVFADTSLLSTLPPAELKAGLQESIKAGIIREPELFRFLDQERKAVLAGETEALTKVVAASVRVKAEVVNADERESGLRMILNLGHTLGHAIEAATEYKQLLHGEAVAWGMLAAIHIALARQMLTAAEATRTSEVIRAYGPLRAFAAEPATLVALTAKDKKNRSGARAFVLPTGIGEAVVVRDVSERELLEAAGIIVAEARSLQPELSGAGR